MTAYGAWTYDYFHDPGTGVALAKSVGLDYLQLFVQVDPPTSTNFALTFSSGEIEALAAAARTAGLDVGITAWIAPYADYIDQAASVLVPLCKSAGASSLMWDAEGPWVHGVGGSKPTQSWWDTAADLITQKFSGLPCPMSVTSYILMEADALAPLTKICQAAFPQAYSSEGYPYKPGEAQTVAWDKWTQEFVGSTSLELQMGLTSYKQSGIPGFTVQQAMTTAADTSIKLGATSLCYWKLSFFTDDEVAAAMKEITGV